MKRSILLVCLVFTPVVGKALDGIYLGARVGQVGLLENLRNVHGNALGFGIDVGVRTSSFLDLLLQYNQSTHGPNLKLSALFISANLSVVHTKEFDFFLGIGPGLYFFNENLVSTTKFGLNGGFGVSVWVLPSLRMGVAVRWQGVFSQTPEDNYWTAMGGIGYLINV